ncbi:MAG: hypothetical protein NTY38_26930, partial [Acidobacteria bacterium]|nr:hypothetical protein [Acidobacteriota bacterium]
MKPGFPPAASSWNVGRGKHLRARSSPPTWLVPVWAQDDLTATHPCAEQPCLHRILADCRHDQVLRLAGFYGLLTATGRTLPAEPVDIWHREI